MSLQIHLPSEDYASTLNELGRANGSMRRRLPPVEGQHDGQVLVRLKKKRYVVLDYSIVPTEADIEAAKQLVHVKIPQGAGRAVCRKRNCSKVGVPVCLYDSDPLQPDPLYLRSGLCYSCQRNLNEDRRGKKRNQGTSISHGDSPNILYALGSGTKKLRIGKSTIFLKDDAIIINGKSQSWRTHSDSYTYAEIGRDLVPLTQEALQETTRLVELTPSLAEASPSRSSSEIDALYDKAFQSMSKALFLLSEWKSSLHQSVGVSLFQEPPSELPEAVATAAAAVAMGQPKAESSSMASLLLAADNTRKDESIEFHHNEMIDGPNDDVPSVYGV